MQNINKTKRELLENAVRTAVYEATVETLRNKGPDGLRMQKIANQAGLATGTLYNYFKDKDDLLFYVHDELFKDFFLQMLKISGSDVSADSKITQTIKMYFLFVKENLTIFEFLQEARIIERSEKMSGYRSDEQCIEVLTGIFQEGLDSGKFKNIDPYRTAELLHGCAVGVLKSKTERKCFLAEKDSDELVKLFSVYLGI